MIEMADTIAIQGADCHRPILCVSHAGTPEGVNVTKPASGMRLAGLPRRTRAISVAASGEITANAPSCP